MSPRQPEDRPLPPWLAALSPRQRLVLAGVGILVGFAIMIGGLKLLDTDVNRPTSDPTPQTTIPGH